MSTINGLPAHVLLVHVIVVLAPIAGVLLMLCGAWAAARRRLVWIMVGLCVAVAIATPVTIGAGEWLQDRLGVSPAIAAHARLGDTMTYVAVALVLGAIVVAGVDIWERRRAKLGLMVRIAVAALAVAIGAGTIAQVYRVGESGSRAVWADQIRAAASTEEPGSLPPGTVSTVD